MQIYRRCKFSRFKIYVYFVPARCFWHRRRQTRRGKCRWRRNLHVSKMRHSEHHQGETHMPRWCSSTSALTPERGASSSGERNFLIDDVHLESLYVTMRIFQARFSPKRGTTIFHEQKPFLILQQNLNISPCYFFRNPSTICSSFCVYIMVGKVL